MLIDNIAKGDMTAYIKTDIPANGEFRGVGFGEVPRGCFSPGCDQRRSHRKLSSGCTHPYGMLVRVMNKTKWALMSFPLLVHRWLIRLNHWKWSELFHHSTLVCHAPYM